MTSVRTTTPNQVDRPSSASRGDSIRLSLKPSSSAKGAVDGAWWPAGGRLVRILGTDNQRIDLLLIPGETVPANAERALTMATDGHDPEITPPAGHHPTLMRTSKDA
jgi:hypothetical protein